MLQPPAIFTESPEVESRHVEVGPDQNLIRVRARGHRWVAVARDGRELVRDLAGASAESGAEAEGTAEFALPPGDYEVRTDGTLRSVEAQHRELPVMPGPGQPLDETVLRALAADYGAPGLRLEADAPERHAVDGVPELPADGQAYCTITVAKVSGSGEQLTGGDHNDEIFLRSTGGSLLDSKGKARVRSVRLKAGRAAFRLVSEKSPKLVTVYAFAADAALAAEIRIEFV